MLGPLLRERGEGAGVGARLEERSSAEAIVSEASAISTKNRRQAAVCML